MVGLGPRGLAVARALARRGLEVLAIEPNGRNPGVQTRLAQILQRGPINGRGLAATLVQVAEERGWSSRPVLFLTNDNIVREVAGNVAALATRYRWSWQDTGPEILRLLNKQHLPRGLPGPRKCCSRPRRRCPDRRMSRR